MKSLLATLAAALLLIAVGAVASLASGARLATISAQSKPSVMSCGAAPHVDVQR